MFGRGASPSALSSSSPRSLRSCWAWQYMQRDKVIRGLRIAWSVWWGTLCVLMIALWIRSFWCWDDAVLRLSSVAVHPISAEGRIVIWFQPAPVAKRFELHTDP